MPQNALLTNVAKTSSGAQSPLNLDAGGNLLVTTGGLKSSLNITAAAVVKATAGRIAKVIVIAPGTTSGAFTINDCATTGAATAANEIWTMAYNATANVAGAVITLDFPVSTGIVVSAVPGAGSPQIAVSYS